MELLKDAEKVLRYRRQIVSQWPESEEKKVRLEAIAYEETIVRAEMSTLRERRPGVA